MATPRFDAITLELLGTRLISIVDEAAVAMVRTSFSTNVRESNGSNISAFGDVRTNPEQNRKYHEINERSYNAVYECSKPTIAMIAANLVHRVVPAAELESAVLDYAATIAANAPLTIKAIKRAFLEQERPEASRHMQAAQDLIDACYRSKDYLEGRAAFAAKRNPVFMGE